jgi:membrane associated rhomboid family serine protease
MPEMKAIKDITIEIAQEQGGTFSSIQTEMGIKTYLFQLIFRLPVELCNPVRRTPIVTYLLIGLCCLMFIYQLSATDMEAQTRALALLPNVLQGEQVWGLVTYIFMHGGIMHLFGNMYMLYVFGDNVEDVVGRSRYLVLFLLCGVAGALMQVIMQSGDIMVVGASGAIAGLMGMYWILFPRVKVRLMILVFPLFVQVQYFFVFWILSNVLGLFGDEGGVALYCHIGGFLFGLLAALPFRNLDIQESSASSS